MPSSREGERERERERERDFLAIVDDIIQQARLDHAWPCPFCSLVSAPVLSVSEGTRPVDGAFLRVSERTGRGGP